MAQLVSLDERQIRAAKLDSQGALTDDIAEAVGVSSRTVYRWKQEPAYQRLVTVLLDDVRNGARHRLLSAARKAAAKIDNLIDSDDERVALSAAQTLLDRAGHGKSERIELAAKVEAKVEPSDAAAELASLMGGGAVRAPEDVQPLGLVGGEE